MKATFYPTIRKKCNLDPCVLWAQIRSFIKGNIEAVLQSHGQYLTEEQYLQLGADRCRFTQNQRKMAYASFLLYERYRIELKYWDTAERIFNVAVGFLNQTPQDRLSYHKVYVDEVQGYTQAEIAVMIMFVLCDCKCVSGVDFRFQEVRSVVYRLTNGDSNRVPAKPVRLTLNFRSHSGILHVAAFVLDRMFEAYPASANQLASDSGLYEGPRPGIYRLTHHRHAVFSAKP